MWNNSMSMVYNKNNVRLKDPKSIVMTVMANFGIKILNNSFSKC